METTKIGSCTFRLRRNPDGTYTSEVVDKPNHERSVPLPPERDILLAKYPSKSNPGEIHKVRHSKKHGFYCTCIGFGVHGHCWHILDTLKKLKETINQKETP